MLVTETTALNQVSDGEMLYRSVWQRPGCLAKDDAGGLHVSSAAFDDRTLRISLSRRKFCVDPPNNNPPRMSQTDFVLALLASRIRQQELTVGDEGKLLSLDVLPDTTDGQHISHAIVHPSLTINKNAFRKIKKRMAEIVEEDWPIPPDPAFVATLEARAMEP